MARFFKSLMKENINKIEDVDVVTELPSPIEEYQKPAPQAKKLDYSFIFNLSKLLLNF